MNHHILLLLLLALAAARPDGLKDMENRLGFLASMANGQKNPNSKLGLLANMANMANAKKEHKENKPGLMANGQKDTNNKLGFLANIENAEKELMDNLPGIVPLNMENGEKDQNTPGFLTNVTRGVEKEIRDAKNPIEEALVTIGSSQCENVKRIVGVAYEQISEKPPELSTLKLVFLSKYINITYGINEAAFLIPESNMFDPRKKLYIYVHGFTDDPSKGSFTNIRAALFSRGEANVVALDGSSLIKWLYLHSTTYVRLMGEKLGEVLAAMVKLGESPNDIHIIGHSLGSHISSFAGKTFTNLTGMKVGRITGLDPAGPCFSHIDEDLRLNATDAQFVDVIHTDAGVFGLKQPCGHVDYWPNEGSQQPNCLFQTCSHSRAWIYYAESVVNPKAFPAVKCKDWEAFKKGDCEKKISYMGHPSKPGTTGQYFLQTGEDPPHGLGEKGTRYQNDESYVKSIFGR